MARRTRAIAGACLALLACHRQPSGGMVSSAKASADDAAPAVSEEQREPAASALIRLAGARCTMPQPASPACIDAFPVTVECPATFEKVPAGALCGLAGRTTVPASCSYPQHVCRCLQNRHCGGPPPTVLEEDGMTWVCAARTKPGDCPGDGSDGLPCPNEGQTCRYGACGSATACVCTKGRYACATQATPLPP